MNILSGLWLMDGNSSLPTEGTTWSWVHGHGLKVVTPFKLEKSELKSSFGLPHREKHKTQRQEAAGRKESQSLMHSMIHWSLYNYAVSINYGQP